MSQLLYSLIYRIYCLLFICFWSPILLNAQPIEQKMRAVQFNLLNPSDFKSSSPDTTSEAVILFEAGNVTFTGESNGTWINFTYYNRTLIRRKSGFRRASLQLTLQRGRNGYEEVFTDFEAYTHNLVDGRVITKPIGEGGRATQATSAFSWVEKFTFPTVHEGSIIEYKYTIKTPFILNTLPRPWHFQHDIPTDWSQYSIITPDEYAYQYILNGYLNLDVNEIKPVKIKPIVYRMRSDATAAFYAMKQIPAFQLDEFMTSENDYVARIEAISPNIRKGKADHAFGWQGIDEVLMESTDFGQKIRKPGRFIEELVKPLIHQHTDSLALIRGIYELVRSQLTWNGYTSIWSADSKEIWAKKTGDTGDINLLLVAALRAANLKAAPVILSTRTNGRPDKDFAILNKFNYLVASVQLNGQDMLLDATDRFLQAGMLPIQCLNGFGRVIDPPNSRFVSLMPTQKMTETKTAQFTLTEGGDLHGTLTQTGGGYTAWLLNKVMAAFGETKITETLRKTQETWQIEKVRVSNRDSTQLTFAANYTLTVPDMITESGDLLYLQPMASAGRESNPLKQPTRQFPIDISTPVEENHIFTITLPEHYVVEEVPKQLAISLPDNGGRFIYQINATGNQIQVISRFTLRKQLYNASEYSRLREFFAQVVTKQAEPVVIRKKLAAPKH